MSQEAVEKRMQGVAQSFHDLITNLQITTLRKMEGEAYRCTAKCCENQTQSMEMHEKCVRKCTENYESAANFVQSEANRFMNRMTRCLQECQDKTKDVVANESSRQLQESYFVNCANNCADAQDKLMQTVVTNMKNKLASGNFNYEL